MYPISMKFYTQMRIIIPIMSPIKLQIENGYIENPFCYISAPYDQINVKLAERKQNHTQKLVA